MAWATSANTARLRRVAAFVAVVWALDAMGVGLASYTSAALNAWAQHRPMESLAHFCTIAAWIMATWGLVLALESCTITNKPNLQTQPKPAIRTASKRQHRKRIEHAAMHDHDKAQPTRQTAERSITALRRVLLESSVRTKHWSGSVVDRRHVATVPEPFDAAVDALLWRFGPDPLTLLSALTEQVTTTMIRRAEQPDIEITVMRRVMRIGWTEVPVMLQPMVGDETYLELHEDLIVCPQAEVRHCQSRTVMSMCSELPSYNAA